MRSNESNTAMKTALMTITITAIRRMRMVMRLEDIITTAMFIRVIRMRR